MEEKMEWNDDSIKSFIDYDINSNDLISNNTEDIYIKLKLKDGREFTMSQKEYDNNIKNKRNKYIVIKEKLIMVNKKEFEQFNGQFIKLSRKERRKKSKNK